MKPILLCLFMFAFVEGACASEATKPHIAQIDCGGTRFNLKTTFGRSTAFRLGIRSQELSFGPDRPVDLRAFGFGLSKGLLLAGITGWLCVKGDHQDILVLAYSCASDVGDGCGGSKEWEHFVSPTGALLDAGFRPEDDRTQALLEHLGIKQQARDGFSMQEVLE